MKEIEAKILEVDRAAIEAKLKSLGAQFEFDEEFYAVYYDTPEGKLKAEGKTIRLRKEGDRQVLTVKRKAENEAGIKMREEHETGIKDYEQMENALAELGYIPVLKMRKQRTQYALMGAHVVIDDYTEDHVHIPVFIEIEGESREKLVEVAEALGYSESDLNPMNAFELIRHYAP